MATVIFAVVFISPFHAILNQSDVLSVLSKTFLPVTDAFAVAIPRVLLRHIPNFSAIFDSAVEIEQGKVEGPRSPTGNVNLPLVGSSWDSPTMKEALIQDLSRPWRLVFLNEKKALPGEPLKV